MVAEAGVGVIDPSPIPRIDTTESTTLTVQHQTTTFHPRHRGSIGEPNGGCCDPISRDIDVTEIDTTTTIDTIMIERLGIEKAATPAGTARHNRVPLIRPWRITFSRTPFPPPKINTLTYQLIKCASKYLHFYHYRG